ncbi:hypothetical protein AB0D35_26885 [Streptomyces sp. NPDC048301]|uniref:hypothetical protein n=1 Tax=unclassified Streptomyces TaxID=2593676 RepID=UPI0034138710
MTPQPAVPTEPLVVGCASEELRRLGVADALIGPALAVTTDEEFDQLIAGAPRLTAEVLTGAQSRAGQMSRKTPRTSMTCDDARL